MKTYTSILPNGSQLKEVHTSFNVGKEFIPVNFTPVFSTDDEELQKAIENDSKFGVWFDHFVEVSEEVQDDEHAIGNNNNSEEFIDVDTVSNEKEAKAWLIANYPDKITAESVSNVDKVITAMKTVDVKPICFTNYKPKSAAVHGTVTTDKAADINKESI